MNEEQNFITLGIGLGCCFFFVVKTHHIPYYKSYLK